MKELVEEYGIAFLAIAAGVILFGICAGFFARGGFLYAVVSEYLAAVC